ncbi:MAG TPA: ACP S-malonyltransferase [Tepidisphaeraceae bacterium]|jgi:[acyl-carrier-protein] S-malonyltransferase|nr:ACP S-malonyltransferase [Tepidisphaeraceae bacterium]
MSSQFVILCPGQGAQVVGMGKELAARSAAARNVYQIADRVLRFGLSDICFNGPEDRLNKTDISQPAIYVTSIASFAAAVECGGMDPANVAVYAGLSLGEYTALHLAGSFDFETGLMLVASRGKFMQEAAEATPSGMVAIIGADEAAVQALCWDSANGNVLSPANFNAPGQIVVSGAADACARVLAAAEAAGYKATALKVAGAFHSQLMAPAAQKMQPELDAAAIAAPRVPVYANVSAQPHGDANAIRQLLVEQIIAPVQWEATMRELTEDATAKFVELLPGRTLAGLAKRINRRLPVESVDSLCCGRVMSEE